MGVAPYITFLIRAALVAVLLAGGIGKLADTRSLAPLLMRLGVPVRQKLLLHILAWAIPLLTVGLGLVIVSGLWPTVTNSLLLLLMGSFSLAGAVALRRKPQEAGFAAASNLQLSGKGLTRGAFLTVVAAVNLWGGNAYAAQVNRFPGVVMLLVAIFLLSAIAATQMTKTIASLKDELP